MPGVPFRSRFKISAITLFIVMGMLFSSWLWNNWHIEHMFFEIFKYLVLLFQLINIFFILLLIFSKKIPSLALSWVALSGSYIIGELLLIAFQIFGTEMPDKQRSFDLFGNAAYGYFNSHAAQWHPHRGHTWEPGKHRVVKLLDNELIYDNTFQANEHGCLSKNKYSYKKSDSIKRFIVFGDSFTDSEFLSVPWPDRCQDTLNSLVDQLGFTYELYNFGIDGGGLPGWHQTFFNVILPEYEFDGIILPVFGDNLSREHNYLHFEDGYAYEGAFEDLPLTDQEFRENYIFNGDRARLIFPGSGLDSLVALQYHKEDWKHGRYLPFCWYMFRFLEATVSNTFFKIMINDFRNEYMQPSEGSVLDPDHLDRKYGSTRMKRLDDMIRSCQENGKEVLLVSIPDKFGMHIYLNGETPILQQELDLIANHYNVPCINGYKLFREIPSDSIDKFYLKHDGHWNQRGADLFAKELAYAILFSL